MITDIAASMLAKLQNKAKESGRSYQLCLQLFCQEEFLRRVELSKYADNLVLKGGLLIYTLTGFDSRATVDVDFLLQQMPNSEADILKMVREIAATETGNSYIDFQVKSIAPISIQRKYNGFRITIVGMIKNTRAPFNIDFGVGDIIVPESEKRKIPSQLDGFAQPAINTYSLESTIAEKFDAIITRLEFNSRMKDFYDIYYIANHFNFDGKRLQEAIFETLKTRGTSYDNTTLEDIENLYTFAAVKTRWRSFLKKIKTSELEFKMVINTIIKFLKPIIEALVAGQKYSEHWDCKEGIWRK